MKKKWRNEKKYSEKRLPPRG